MADDVPKPDRVDGNGEIRPVKERQENEMISNIAEPVRKPSGPSFAQRPNQLEKDLVQVFKLLSDETRLRILFYLMREKELHVTALCDKLGQSQPAVSHHLALLRVAGLIEARRDGKHNDYSVRTSHFHRIMEELVQNISEDKEEIRFEDFVLSYGNE